MLGSRFRLGGEPNKRRNNQLETESVIETKAEFREIIRNLMFAHT